MVFPCTAAKFKPGSIANLEYDVTAHHVSRRSLPFFVDLLPSPKSLVCGFDIKMKETD